MTGYVIGLFAVAAIFFLTGAGTASLYWLWKSEARRADAALAAAQKLGLQHEPAHASPILATIPAAVLPEKKVDLPFAIDDQPEEPSPDGLELNFMIGKIMEEQGLPLDEATAMAEQMLKDFRSGGNV